MKRQRKSCTLPGGHSCEQMSPVNTTGTSQVPTTSGGLLLIQRMPKKRRHAEQLMLRGEACESLDLLTTLFSENVDEGGPYGPAIASVKNQAP